MRTESRRKGAISLTKYIEKVDRREMGKGLKRTGLLHMSLMEEKTRKQGQVVEAMAANDMTPQEVKDWFPYVFTGSIGKELYTKAK